MGQPYAFKSGTSHHVIILGASDWIALAAAPIFAILAGLAFILEAGPPDVLCSATQHASPLNGMTVMYALMSVFHSTPWVRLVSGRRDGPPPTQCARPTSISK